MCPTVKNSSLRSRQDACLPVTRQPHTSQGWGVTCKGRDAGNSQVGVLWSPRWVWELGLDGQGCLLHHRHRQPSLTEPFLCAKVLRTLSPKIRIATLQGVDCYCHLRFFGRGKRGLGEVTFSHQEASPAQAVSTAPVPPTRPLFLMVSPCRKHFPLDGSMTR